MSAPIEPIQGDRPRLSDIGQFPPERPIPPPIDPAVEQRLAGHVFRAPGSNGEGGNPLLNLSGRNSSVRRMDDRQVSGVAPADGSREADNRPIRELHSRFAAIRRELGACARLARTTGVCDPPVTGGKDGMDVAIERMWNLVTFLSLCSGMFNIGTSFLQARRMAVESELKFSRVGQIGRRMSKDRIQSMVEELERFAARNNRKLDELLRKIEELGADGGDAQGKDGAGAIAKSLAQASEEIEKVIGGFERRIEETLKDKRDDLREGNGPEGR